MSVDQMHKASQSVRRRGFVCLVLFVFALFSMAITNHMMSTHMELMQHAVQIDHNMSEHHIVKTDHHMHIDGSDCQPETMLGCGNMAMDHSHQDCLDSHCSTFSGLLLAYLIFSDHFFAVHNVLPLQSYVSLSLSTPYFPPIVIS
ncbi:hypothetical protein OFY17_14745 [Marinomonas sp. C2222]|uniref:DUF2946 domain-containing protein n=1 Tax=Marinomonas sargassi TaxID=2984494 RepID=A0ABT2YW39_9GAMM|nr:hypothetical protein [Marinomonas sargassi]MCV2404121.1 hypothetical protein [Marinomonas sargassi]